MTTRELDTIFLQTMPKTLVGFLSSIRNARANSSLSTIQAIGYLDSVIDAFIPEGRMMCDNLDILEQDHKDFLQMHAKIVAAQMVLLLESRSYQKLSSRSLLFLEYTSHMIKGEYDFAKKAVEVLSYPLTSLGFSWSNIEQAPFLSTIVHQFFKDSRVDRNSDSFGKFSFSAKGQMSVEGGKITICSSPLNESGALAFSICDDTVDIITRNTRDERLKASDSMQVEKLEEFSKTFVRSQDNYSKAQSQIALKALVPNEKYSICVTGLSEDEQDLVCSPLGVKGDYIGTIYHEQLMKGIYTEDLMDYIYDNDCIEGAELMSGGDSPVFSIKKAYSEFARKQAEKDFRDNIVFEAKVLEVLDDIDRVNWITSGGYGGISAGAKGLTTGDIRVLEVMNQQTTSSGVFINLRAPRGFSSKAPARKFDDEKVLAGFVKSYKEASEDAVLDSKIPAATAEQISRVRHLARIFSHSGSGNSLENYKRLLVSQFLSVMISDDRYVFYPKSRAAFLANCIALAQKKQLRPWTEDMSPLQEERLILKALSCFFTPEDTISASEILSECKPGTKPYFVAQHVLARSLSVHIPDEVRSSADDFRAKLSQELGVYDMFQSSGCFTPGKYGNAESEDIEFKSSYVMRNDGKGADIDKQGRGEVFQAVCGFLNKDGGTVYVGVGNNGDPLLGAHVGLNADMKWLSDNYMHILEKRIKQLGHPVPKADTLDHMALFLNDEKELYFKPSLHDYITISPTPDNDAIRILVRPAKYEIAVLYKDKSRTEGTAFVRDGQETIPMTRIRQEQRLMDLKSVNRDVSHILNLQQAIDAQKKVLLHDYASGSSGEVRDRIVVPINLFYNDESVYCYDLGAKDFRQFRVSRIGSVEPITTEDDSYPHSFEPRYADLFRWIGDEDLHIKLRMDTACHNYLLEEYSMSRSLSESELYQDGDNSWILDVHLQGLFGLRRFYLGLADRMEILPTEDSDRFKNYLMDYIQSNLTNQNN